jgi:hypothetical protein
MINGSIFMEKPYQGRVKKVSFNGNAIPHWKKVIGLSSPGLMIIPRLVLREGIW